MFTKTAPIKPAKRNGHHPAFSLKERPGSPFIPSIQPKLEVGEPNSIYEAEADRMADQVVLNSAFYRPSSFIAPAPVQTAPLPGPTTEKDPDDLLEDILPPTLNGESDVASDAEAEKNPTAEKPETEAPPVPDQVVEEPGKDKGEEKEEKSEPAEEEKEEEAVPETKGDDVSPEDAAAFQGEANMEPVAPVEITPELSKQFVQPKLLEVRRQDEGEVPEEAQEQGTEKLQAKFSVGGTDEGENGSPQRSGVGEETSSTKVEQGLASGKNSGETLPLGTRGQMESQFGADFSEVRIHSDGNAQTMNNALRARAFTHENHIYFNKDQYDPASSEGRHLLAHELTHTVQQGAAVQRKPQISHTQPKVQRLGIGDALDYFADKANNIPGYRMFTVILGVNPINMSSVDRSAGNIIRAMIEFLPGGKLITDALDNHGIFSRVSAWFKEQMDSLSITGSSIRSAINEFLDSLGWSDIFDLGDVWRRAKRIFTTPIDRLISFAKSLVTQIMDWVKEAILRPLALLAEGTPAYDLLRVALGSDPITGDPYPPTADNLIGGFMKLIGQEEIWENIKKGNAVARAFAWFKGAMSGLSDFITTIPTTIIETIKSLTWQDVVLVVGAFQKIGRAFLNVAGKFLAWAGGTVLDLLEIIFSVVAPAVVPWLKKAGGAFNNILENPIGFIGNLVQAAKQGFMKFAANIGKHLKSALINWLMGSLAGAGIYIPTALSISEILKFVLSVLGISWANLRIKLVKHLGEPAVKALETGFELVTILVTKGPLAMWERIKEQLSDLKSMVMGEIMSWVVTKVVTKAITKLVSSLNPAGAVIQAILFIYDTVTFLIDKISQIARVGMAVLDSMAAIASGAIGAAVAKVEQTLAGMLSLAISFLAKFLGLGKISEKVVSIVKKIQQKVDKAIDTALEWIVNKAKAFMKKLVKKDDDSKHQQYATEAIGLLGGASTKKNYKEARAEKMAQAVPIENTYNAKLKNGVKMKIKFTPEAADEKDQDIDFKVIIAPNTTTIAGTAAYISYTQADVPGISIEFKFNKKAQYAKEPGAKEEYQRQIDVMRGKLNELSIGQWESNRENFLEIQTIKGKDKKKQTLTPDEQKKLDKYNTDDRIARENARNAAIEEIIDDMLAAAGINQANVDDILEDRGIKPANEKERKFYQESIFRELTKRERDKLRPKAIEIFGQKGHNRAALHLDKVAGGGADKIIEFGDSKVNSAIGSTLAARFRYKKVVGEKEIKKFLDKVSLQQKQELKMNATFNLN